MERRDIDDVIEPASGCVQRGFQVGERQSDLSFEIRFRRPIGMGADLTGHEQQIFRSHCGGVAVRLVKGVSICRIYCFALCHHHCPSLVGANVADRRRWTFQNNPCIHIRHVYEARIPSARQLHIRSVSEQEIALVTKPRAETVAENRIKLIGAARKAFAVSGFAEASMDALTAEVGLTRGALYHGFGDKKGLLAAVVAEVDGEMAARARDASEGAKDPWARLMAEGEAYIGMALDPEIRRIVLLDGPAFLGDPSTWPSQNACLDVTQRAVADLIDEGVMRPVDAEAAARLLSGAAFNAALWVAASDKPHVVLPRATKAFRIMAEGFLTIQDRS